MGFNNPDDVYAKAAKQASMYHHGEITPIHLLAQLLAEENDVAALLAGAGVDVPGISRNLRTDLISATHIKKDLPGVKPAPNDDLRAIVATAQKVSNSAGLPGIDSKTLFFSLLDYTRRKNALIGELKVRVLKDQNAFLQFGEFVRTKMRLEEQPQQPAPGTVIVPSLPRPQASTNVPVLVRPHLHKAPSGSILDRFGTNLNARAMEGKIDPLIGREDELNKMVRVLGQRKKKNPLLVGEPGVGKTAMAEGLARRMVEGNVPEYLRRKNIYSINMNTMVAGTKYRGEFEERIKNLVDELKNSPDVILFIDELHTIMGAGTAEGSGPDAGNVLKPALASGEIQCIGATTYKEEKKILKDGAQARRWGRVPLDEPSLVETRLIIQGLKNVYEKYHNVFISDEAVEADLKLARRFIHQNQSPDREVEVIDHAASAVKMRQGNTVEVADIEEAVAALANIPSRNVKTSERDALRNLEKDLNNAVFDQGEAIKTVVRAIRMSRAGLGVAERPVASLLFKGPTGVGKTELVKQLHKTLGMKLLRLDMSEYMEKHAVARLIGSPPGYVGHEEGGKLTEFVRNNPHSIILLDEIEKAHEDINAILLQVMEGARLTDGEGRTVNFENTIVIMTSNLGTGYTKKASVGPSLPGSNEAKDARNDEAVKKHFKPEFINRVDAVVEFEPLKPETMDKMVDKFLAEVASQLEDKKVSLTITPEAKKYLATKGYDDVFGARPLGRIFRQELRIPLSDELLDGQLENGGKAKIDVVEDKNGKHLTFAFNEAAGDAVPANDNEAEPPRKRKGRDRSEPHSPAP